MTVALVSLRGLTDDAVTTLLKQCVADERKATAALLRVLAEFDVRRLYLSAGFSSLFDYCTRHLHLSERAAGSRIAVARLARRFPLVLELIADSQVSLTAMSILARHINEANHQSLLEEAAHKTVGEVEMIVARLAPQPDVKPLVRKVAPPAQHLALATPIVPEVAPRQIELQGAPVSRAQPPPLLRRSCRKSHRARSNSRVRRCRARNRRRP